jgi:hypothetical protein
VPFAVEYCTENGEATFPVAVTVNVAVTVPELPSVIRASLIETFGSSIGAAIAVKLTFVALLVSGLMTAVAGEKLLTPFEGVSV